MFTITYRGVTITWNGSATFNVFRDGINIDAFTAYPTDKHDAARIIINTIDDYYTLVEG